jgi:hypothetical protein
MRLKVNPKRQQFLWMTDHPPSSPPPLQPGSAVRQRHPWIRRGGDKPKPPTAPATSASAEEPARGPGGAPPAEALGPLLALQQTFNFLFDAPPREWLLWACLLAGASRDLYPARL